MKSTVYFIPVDKADTIQGIDAKLKRALDTSVLLACVQKGDTVAVKVHFGEEGNTGFVDPEHVRVVCDGITARGARPLLSDTNTLYRGRRLNSADHLKLAHEHGFTRERAGADVFIPDDNQEADIVDVPVNRKFINVAKVGRIFIDADVIVAVTHFKGHILTGFGGVLKNIGMGCATRAGKLAQHRDVAPVVHETQCTGCGECAIVCPTKAIRIQNEKSTIDVSKCIGCASCMAACPTMAMFIDFGAGNKVQDKMVDYAFAVLKDKKNKAVFLNFALKINKECDCWGMENPRIAPDVGILLSLDPVSIDKASFDLVKKACNKDIFKEVHPEQNGIRQLQYAQEIGLGNLDYELVEL